jgi:hypothetical protein
MRLLQYGNKRIDSYHDEEPIFIVFECCKKTWKPGDAIDESVYHDLRVDVLFRVPFLVKALDGQMLATRLISHLEDRAIATGSESSPPAEFGWIHWGG